MKKIILAIALPMLRAIGVQLREADADDEGMDDFAGALIEYSADVTDAVLAKRDIPFPPDSLLDFIKSRDKTQSADTQPLAEA